MNPSEGTAPALLSEGTMVNANVRLTRPLGEGAMGEVWVARHLTLKTDVAVKFISPILVNAHPELVMRFEQEASLAAQIKSPHVVQTFDHGVTEAGMPYIVMELLEGESLDEMLLRNGPLPLPAVAQVVVQLARALTKAHAQGIVHRDIKPDNIFVTPMEDGLFCKLLDFGIAKQTQLPQVGGITNAGVMIGTPEYMSPEQVMSSSEVDYRTDLWALAVTTYHILTGQLPFSADTLGRLCVLVLDAKYAAPSSLRPSLSPAIDGWFARALAKDASRRFDAARDMAREFVRIVKEQGATLEEMSLLELSSDTGPMSAPQLSSAGAAIADVGQAQSGATHGTLSGSASNLRRPVASKGAIIGMAAAASALLIGGVTAVVMMSGDESSTPQAETMAPAASQSLADDSDGDETADDAESQPEEPASAASAAPTTSASVAPAPVASVRWPKTAAPAQPSAAPIKRKRRRKDHGF